MVAVTGRGAAVAAALLLVSAAAAAQPRTEHEVKAAYLYTFGRFVEWPPTRNQAEFAICILGADPFGPVLDSTLAGTSVRGRRVVARRLATAVAAPACHILFISSSEERSLDTVFAALGRSDVLTVSDMPQFVGRGGMIQFHTADNRVRFEIDLQPALDAGLRMSSDLLRVASAVRKAGTRP